MPWSCTLMPSACMLHVPTVHTACPAYHICFATVDEGRSCCQGLLGIEAGCFGLQRVARTTAFLIHQSPFSTAQVRTIPHNTQALGSTFGHSSQPAASSASAHPHKAAAQPAETASSPVELVLQAPQVPKPPEKANEAAQAAVQHLQPRQTAPHGSPVAAEYIGAGFGAAAEVVQFWGSQGFHLLHVGGRRGAESGLPSAVVLLPLTTLARDAVREAVRRCRDSLPYLLTDCLADLSPDAANALLRLAADAFCCAHCCVLPSRVPALDSENVPTSNSAPSHDQPVTLCSTPSHNPPELVPSVAAHSSTGLHLQPVGNPSFKANAGTSIDLSPDCSSGPSLNPLPSLGGPANDAVPPLCTAMPGCCCGPYHAPHVALLPLSSADWFDLCAYAFGPRPYDSVVQAVWVLVTSALRHYHHFEALLDSAARDLLVVRVLQRRPWAAVANLFGFDGVANCMRALRRALQPLIQHFAPRETAATLKMFH